MSEAGRRAHFSRVGDEVIEALAVLNRGLPSDLRPVALALALEDAVRCTVPDGLLSGGGLETPEAIRTFLSTLTSS